MDYLFLTRNLSEIIFDMYQYILVCFFDNEKKNDVHWHDTLWNRQMWIYQIDGFIFGKLKCPVWNENIYRCYDVFIEDLIPRLAKYDLSLDRST